MKNKREKGWILGLLIFMICGFSGMFGTQEVQAAQNDLVIVIDPGHDSLHPGASYFGLREENLNLRIALACRQELQQYFGVNVYLTHDSLNCPHPQGSTRSCLFYRSQYAASVGADLLVSLHNNAGYSDPDHSGYEIYYPNGNYRPEFHDIGGRISECIANQLSSIGVNRLGLYTRDSDDDEVIAENFYPDGSRADYYNIIRNAKYYGFVGLIIEHAYVSNYSDATTLLNNNSVLDNMGVADARGIAQYYGLPKKTSINGLCKDRDGIWHYYENGEIATGYTGLAPNEYGWWYIQNGEVNFDFNGLACNEYGWWYFENGYLNFNYTGMANNEYGWWYVINGGVDFSYTGMAENEYGWWYYTNGNIDWHYTGMAVNEYNWWYYYDGRIDWTYTGMANNEYGWWYYTNGNINWTYTGIGQNEYGLWYYQNGWLDFNYSGHISADGINYNIVNGYATEIEDKPVPDTAGTTTDPTSGTTTDSTAGTMPDSTPVPEIPKQTGWVESNGSMYYYNESGILENAKGIDVSSYQGTIDWNAVKNDGIKFAIIRIGVGDNITSQDDSTAAYNMNECERLGIPYGVYLATYAVDDREATGDAHADSEADHMLRLLQGRTPKMGVYVDVETTQNYTDNGLNIYSTEGRKKITAWTNRIIHKVSAAGYSVGVYANRDYFNNVLIQSELATDQWIAAPDTTMPEGTWCMWQYGEGTVAGITNQNGESVSVDLDYWLNK